MLYYCVEEELAVYGEVRELSSYLFFSPSSYFEIIKKLFYMILSVVAIIYKDPTLVL